MRLVPGYRPRASALHAAGAGPAVAYCGALALVPILYDNPIVLAGALAAIVAAAIVCGVGRELAAAAALALPLALLVVLINPIVSQEGETVLVRGWVLLGTRFDITLEALAFGLVTGLRVVVLMLAFALYSAAVDPDELLRALRRIAPRSGLTVVLATRLVPVLARDARRRADAARCRPDAPGRLAIARAALAGALDRAVESAAALEVRGFGGARRLREARRSWSRHDFAVAATALLLALAALGPAVAGFGWLTPYPRFEVALGLPELALALAMPALALLPLVGPGRLGVASA